MQRALELAKKANPSPNPKVGAIIVKNNKIIAARDNAKEAIFSK